MEFHVWGKLDENGKIQSVQSSCSNGNAFNFLPDQSPTTPPSGGGSPWIGPTGEKYVPYSTKKELCYKLDSRLDEMSLMMVQMGEMTKRLQLQEKLIQEYETKSERQLTELHQLRHENKELRSLVSKRKRTCSGPLGPTDLPDPFFGSTCDTSMTTPKTIDTPMECSEVSQINSSTSSDKCNLDDVDGAKHVHDVINSDDVKTLSEYDNSPTACDIFAKDKKPMEMGNPLPCDEHGYLILGDEGESQNLIVRHVHFTLDSAGYIQIPDTTSADQANLSNQAGCPGLPDQLTSYPDTVDGLVGEGGDQAWQTGRDAVSDGSAPKHGHPDDAVSGDASSHDAKLPPNVKTVPTAMDSDIPKPEVHSPSRYEFIPDGLVSRRTPSTEGHGQDQGQCQGQRKRLGSNRYNARPPMPLPGHASCGSNLDKAFKPDTPHRKRLSKELKNCSSDETRDTETMRNGHTHLHRHSSPDILGALAADERLKTLIANMKTTMEWNQARRRLMAKSTDYTVDQAEETLRAIVKETYYSCTKHVSGKGKLGPTVESLAQNLHNTLLKQHSFDKDILTQEFLQKCIHLLRAL